MCNAKKRERRERFYRQVKQRNGIRVLVPKWDVSSDWEKVSRRRLRTSFCISCTPIFPQQYVSMSVFRSWGTCDIFSLRSLFPLLSSSPYFRTWLRICLFFLLSWFVPSQEHIPIRQFSPNASAIPMIWIIVYEF